MNTRVREESAGAGRDAALSVAARLIAMVASSATAIVVAAALVPAQYGAYALAAGLAGLLVAALDIGLTSSLARYLAQKKAAPALFVRIVLLRFLLASVGAGTVLGVWALQQSGAFGSAAISDDALFDLVPAAALLLVLQSFAAMLYGTLPAMRRVRLLVVITVVQPVIELAFVAWALTTGGQAQAVLIASAGAAGIVAIIAGASLVRNKAGMISRSADAASVSDVMTYGRVLFLVSLLIIIFGQLDQFVIWVFHGSAEVAPYALSIKLQALITAPAVTMTAIIAPRIAGAATSGGVMYLSWLRFFAVLHIGLIAIGAVLAREIFTAINPVYSGQYLILVALLPSMMLTSLAPLPSITLNQSGHASERRKIAIITLVINLVLDVALVPWLVAYGAAISTTISFTYYLIAHHRAARAALGIKPAVRAFPIAAIIRIAVAGATIAAVAVLTRAIVNSFVSEAPGRVDEVIVVLVAGGAAATLHLIGTLRNARPQ